MEPLVSQHAIAALLGITPHHVLRLYRQQTIPGYKVGKLVRFRESEVLAASAQAARRSPGSAGSRE